MNAWPSQLASRWFVVATSARVASRPVAVTLLDRPIVLARMADGRVVAFDDRCPHRLVPLSDGRIVPAGLRCAYHGWTFDRTGRCVAMPGLAPPECVPEVRLRAMRTREADGLVWLRIDASTEGDDDLPAFVSRLSPDRRRFLWEDDWAVHAVDALENFLDPVHTPLLHPGLVRRDDRRVSIVATVTHAAGAMTIDYTGAAAQSGLLYRLFESPRTLERAHFAPSAAGSAQLEYRYRNGSAVYFTLHFTPETATTTRLHATLHVDGRWAPRWLVRTLVGPFLRRVAAQDRRMVERQTANAARFGRHDGLSTSLDLARPALDAVWRPGAATPPDGSHAVRLAL